MNSALVAPSAPVVSTDNTDEYQDYDNLHKEKYRDEAQKRLEHTELLSRNLSSNDKHYSQILEAIYYNRFLCAGRVQAALGASEREVSPFNCSVSQNIEDDMGSIMAGCSAAAMILRLGTGIGFNFSRLRPAGAEIKKTKTQSSGPLSFMKIYDVMASTIASSGHRRGAMMGIMNVSHPDIEAFVDAKMEKGAYRQFNLSVGITDDFMQCVTSNKDYQLAHEGKVYRTIKASALWEHIVKNAYNSAEPGVLFVDRFNEQNNLYYCEHMDATNPCAEQPLPPYGLCTLGSFNMIAYVFKTVDGYKFNWEVFKKDVKVFVEAYDNIFDEAVYAIPEHRTEAISKRRIGLGMTGVASAIELILGRPSYGEFEFCQMLDAMCRTLAYEAYSASSDLAVIRGSFPLYDKDKYAQSKFIQTLPAELQTKIYLNGMRNSHLISYAPCGTISQCAGNVSSGIEPIFYYEVDRKVHMKDGLKTFKRKDFNYREHNFKGKTLDDCTVTDHINVARTVQRWCDSSISKTVNVAANCTYEEYESIYNRAYDAKLKGITVFRPTELRGAVIVKAEATAPITERTFENAHCANGACSL